MLKKLSKTPAYVLDESKLHQNLMRFKTLKEKTGCKVILALKAFSTYCAFELMSQYLDGTTSSSLHEVMLAKEEFGKDRHVYSPGFHTHRVFYFFFCTSSCS